MRTQLGNRLQCHNELLFVRHSPTIIVDSTNPIPHTTYQGDFWLGELPDR